MSVLPRTLVLFPKSPLSPIMFFECTQNEMSNCSPAPQIISSSLEIFANVPMFPLMKTASSYVSPDLAAAWLIS